MSELPDVIFFDAALNHLYVAIGDPGVIDKIDEERMRRMETGTSEKGAHTIAFDPDHHKVYAFLPETHRAAIFVDRIA